MNDSFSEIFYCVILKLIYKSLKPFFIFQNLKFYLICFNYCIEGQSAICLNYFPLSIYRARGPIDCDTLRNDLSIQAKKSEEKIMNTWYPKVINLFTRKEALEGIKPEKTDSFYNCVSILMSNQVYVLLCQIRYMCYCVPFE